jgi:hypothetical protein
MKFSVTQILPKKFSCTQLSIPLPGQLSLDVVQCLTGDWYKSGSKYYFRDHSGNGYDAEILGFDAEELTGVGFSYNSNAKIKQPSSGSAFTALQAADFNNFWYISGVPREIPYCLLFQDIHYHHQIFSRHYTGTYTNGYVKDICTYDHVLTGNQLSAAKSFFGVPTELVATALWVDNAGNDTTGTGTKALPFKTIQHAVTVANPGDTIYLGYVYDKVDLTAKLLHIQGTGYSEINGTQLGAGAFTLKSSLNSTFKNLVISNFDQTGNNGVISITGGSPKFYLCNLGIATIRYHPHQDCTHAMDISGASLVEWYGGNINYLPNLASYLIVNDTSDFKFIGGYVRGCFKFNNASTGNINIDIYGGSASFQSHFYNTSIVTFNVRTDTIIRDLLFNELLGYLTSGWRLYDTAILNLKYQKRAFAVNLISGTPVLNLSQSIATIYPYINAGAGVAAGAIVNINYCQLTLDVNNDISGVHNLEDFAGINWNIKHSTIEFSGHSGLFKTMGQPIGLTNGVDPVLLIEDSIIIDHCDDGVPFGLNYPVCVANKGKTTIRRSKLINMDYDGISANKLLVITKDAGHFLNVVLEDVEFISDVTPGGNLFQVIKSVPLTINDYVDIIGTFINHTQEYDPCDVMADWNYLLANAP